MNNIKKTYLIKICPICDIEYDEYDVTCYVCGYPLESVYVEEEL